jgi:hypothetical protein
MGVSTDGCLAYGLVLDEGEPSWIFEDSDWEVIIAEKLCGLKPPSEPYEGNEKIHREYWDKQKIALKEIDLCFENYCSGDYPIYMLAIASTVKTAKRGYPEKLNDFDSKVHLYREGNNPYLLESCWNDELKKACKKLDIKYDSKQVGYWLYSYWG